MENSLGPAHSRLWIFPLERSLDASQTSQLLALVEDFLATWVAHKQAVSGKATVLEGKFLLVSADEDITHVSGCSNDSLFRLVQSALGDVGSALSDPSRVHFRSNTGEIHTCSRAEFRELFSQGKLSTGTMVFDPTIAKVSEFSAGNFEKPLRESWHARLVPA